MSRTAKILATLFVGLVVTAALFPSLLAPGDPLAVNPSEAFQAPSLQYPFGTDESGRNVYTRVVHGTADSLTIGLAATALGMGIAILLGVITACFFCITLCGFSWGCPLLCKPPASSSIFKYK